MNNHKQFGFTLMEIMVVVAIIGILASIAYPSYMTHVTKSYRTAAKTCLMEHIGYMERFYSTNFAYNKTSAGTAISIPALNCKTDSKLDSRYTITVDTLANKTFRVVATPIGVQLAKDTECGTLTINQSDSRTASGTGGTSACW